MVLIKSAMSREGTLYRTVFTCPRASGKVIGNDY